MRVAGSGDVRAGLSELQLRIVSALVLAAGALGSAWAGGWVFVLVWAGLGLLILLEWLAIVRGRAGAAGWILGGLGYSAAMVVSVVSLRLGGALGLEAMFVLFAVVWATDIFAFFAGRTFGGPKLAPLISPKKTWSGMIGGVAGGVLAGLAILAAFGVPLRPIHGLLCAILALASVAGDLFESWFKRRFGVKDSGHLIPGHGGFMDRMDGFVFAATLAALIGVARGGLDGAAEGLLAW